MPKGISKVMSVDGKQVYVIGTGDGSDGAGAFVILDTIAERDAIITDRIVLVRQAYKNDPTVNRGWAAYIYDAAAQIHWVKIAEEESVDGPWGVQAEILKSCITKAQFLEYTNKTDAAIAELSRLVDFSETAHTHRNKTVLDAIQEEYGLLTYKGRTIAGNSYLYDVVEDGKLMWKDPTDADAVAVAKEYSLDIATEFGKTSIAQNGMELDVVETNGAISTFKFKLVGEDLVPVFVGIKGGDVVEVARVLELPLASAECVNGLYEVLPSAHCVEGIAGHFYKCVANEPDESEPNAPTTFRWVDLNAEAESSTPNGHTIITACYREAWNKNVIMWKASSDAVNTVRSVVVRKFGSAPTSYTDGVVVFECNDSTGRATDTVPLTKDQVFYGVFQFNGGGCLLEPATAESRYIDWATIKAAVENGFADKIFAIDDVIVIEHSVFGNISCKVLAVEGGKVKLAAMSTLADLEFDGRERGMSVTSDYRFLANKDYYTYSVDGDMELFTKLVPGTNYNVGENITGTVYEAVTSSANSPWAESYDQISGICHGNAAWKGSNIEQYLNSDAENDWFTPDNYKSDRKGASFDEYNQGWLAGIVDADLKSIIGEVRLPTSEDEIVASGKVWTMVLGQKVLTSSELRYVDRKIQYRDEDGEMKYADPEGLNRRFDGTTFVSDYIGVAPVIILGATEETEQPVVTRD